MLQNFPPKKQIISNLMSLFSSKIFRWYKRSISWLEWCIKWENLTAIQSFWSLSSRINHARTKFNLGVLTILQKQTCSRDLFSWINPGKSKFSKDSDFFLTMAVSTIFCTSVNVNTMCPRLAVSVRIVTFVVVYLRESRNHVLSILDKKSHDLSYNSG